MKTVKSLFLMAVILFCGAFNVNAQIGGQKLAYVDSDYILNNIPEYGDAQEELNALSTQWRLRVALHGAGRSEGHLQQGVGDVQEIPD